jgi:hypothetical protein
VHVGKGQSSVVVIIIFLALFSFEGALSTPRKALVFFRRKLGADSEIQ